MGALASALTGAYDGIGGVPGMIIMLLAGGAAGMFWGGISGVLKAYFGASEVVTTLMLNYVALELIDYLASGPLQVSNAAQTKFIPRRPTSRRWRAGPS